MTPHRCSTKLARLFANSSLALALVCGASACAADTDDIELKFADTYAATHPIGEFGAQPFLEELREKGAEVGITIDYYGPGQLGGGSEMPTMMRTGVVDIGVISPSNVSAEFPLSSVSELPGMFDDVCAGSNALIGSMQEGGAIYEEELEPAGIRPLWAAFVTDYEVMTTNTEVRTPADAAGQLLRSNGGIGDRVVERLGASGVSLPGPDIYEALSRGTVSGAIFPPVSVLSYGLEETLKYSTIGSDLGVSNSTYAISTEAWEQLNSEQREVVTAASNSANEVACTELPAQAEAAFGEMQKAGVELLEIPGEQQGVWDGALDGIRNDWVEDLESVGAPATFVLDDFTARLKEQESE